jgi:hypothetical protein
MLHPSVPQAASRKSRKSWSQIHVIKNLQEHGVGNQNQHKKNAYINTTDHVTSNFRQNYANELDVITLTQMHSNADDAVS